MKKIYWMLLTGLLCPILSHAQPTDLVLNSAESGAKLHQATNSITFAPGYSYTPNGGTMTAEIMEDSGSDTYENIAYTAFVDPEVRELNTSYLVGTTNGNLGVSAMGGANYTIPINVLPGIAGLQPSLAVAYNSMSGSGIVGYGWGISGMSAIARSPKTYYHDGTANGIELTTNDRFSMDGQRLICVSGSYGANGSQYRTENDIFSKITCYTNGNGADKFLVKTKSGLECQYGYVANSDQTIEGHNETLNWYINKVTDVYGNEMNYQYIKDDGFIYPREITYGPNTITFYYKTRSDQTINYFLGSSIQQNLLLDKIELKYNSNVVKKYEFKYNYRSSVSNNTSNSFLNEVIEYGLNNSRFNSTVFSYQATSTNSISSPTTEMSGNYYIYSGDLDGDGVSDLITLDKNTRKTFKLYINRNGILSYTDTKTTNIPIVNIVVQDLNGNGVDDIITIHEVPGAGYRYAWILVDDEKFGVPHEFLNKPTIHRSLAEDRTLGIFNYYALSRATYQNRIADFDGDGLADFLVISENDNSWEMYSFTKQSLNTTFLLNNRSGTVSSWGDKIFIADYNGDGKTDIWSFSSDGLVVYTLENGNLATLYSNDWPTKDHYVDLGDYNGDGKADMFLYGYKTYDWSTWQIHLSTGTDFDEYDVPALKSYLKDDRLLSGDFNGDSKTDILALNTSSSGNQTQYFLYSKDDGKGLYKQTKSISLMEKDKMYCIRDFEGDGRSEIFFSDDSHIYSMEINGSFETKLEKVADGLNRRSEIVYEHLSESNSPYAIGTGAQFPVSDYQGALSVVSSISVDNGIGTMNRTDYSYEGAKIHRQGKGFLCYAKMTVTDVASNMKTESNYGYNTTYYYPQLISTFNKYLNTTLSVTSNSWAHKSTASGVIMPYISTSTQANNLTGSSMTQTAVYDTYGNLTSSEKIYNNGVTETTTSTYTNDATNWLIGKMMSSVTEFEKSGETTVTKSVEYTYASDGILKPDYVYYRKDGDLYYYENYDYSSGNIVNHKYGSGAGTRQVAYAYESNKVRMKTIVDELGHTTTKNYDAYGRLSSEVDYLSNTSSFTYDNIGRILTQTQPDGFISTTSYNWGLTGGPTYACYNVNQSGNDGSMSKTWYDKLARQIRVDVTGFDGSPIYTTSEYNTKGQLYRVSEPSTSVSPSQWNTNTYDNYGRQTHITRPSGRNTTFTYNNNRITEITGDKATWRETDSQGLVTKADDSGGDIVYSYYPDGKIKRITAPGGVETYMEYSSDNFRNQTKLVDPSAGTITYTYNQFSQLRTQKNARNQTSTFNYYTDGRLSTKVTPEGTTTYTYNTNKQLTGVSSPGGVSKSYGYDSKGRVNNITETIPGSSVFSTIFTYDTKGRLNTRTHPSGIVETNHYNSYGYLDYIQAGGVTRYTITEMNERQQITAATYGSNLYGTFGFDAYGYPSSSKAQSGSTYRQDYRYSFTLSTGNLYSRENYLKSKSESFTYDNLDRLLTVTGPQNLTMDYAANGNIITKSDVGTNAFSYKHATNPYALTGVETSSGLIAEESQGETYTSFEQVSTIDEGDYHAQFTYNSDDQRAKMIITDTGSTILTRWYVGSRYIKETEGSTTKEYTWIGGDAYSAPVVAEKTGSTIAYYYLLRDYLGNITHKVNTSNTVVAEYSYDAWGRRRDKDDWSYTLSGEPGLLAGRAFTSHEYLPWFELVNMNGRLYDPVVGRFLSADPYVQEPGLTQSYNRYSYCLNNPLKYTDPNGEWFFSLIFPGVGTVIDVFLWSATIDYATQVITNYATREPGESFKDWAWKDIDWLDVGVSGVASVTTMGLDKVYKAGKISKILYRSGQVGINAGLPAISARYDWKPASDGEKFTVNRGDKFWIEYSYTVVKQYTATQTTNNIIKHLYSDKPWVLNNNPVKKQVLEGLFDLPASVGAGWWSDKYYDSRHVEPEPLQVPLLPGETPLPDNWGEDINNYFPNNQDIQKSLQLNKF